MKRIATISLVCAIFLLICMLFSCAKKEEREAPPRTVAEWEQEVLDLDKAIIEAPSEIISAMAPLDIMFREPVVPPHLKGSILDKNPFTFEPEVDGHAVWLAQNTLRFVPDELLSPGKEIHGILHGKIAFGEQRNVNDFRFSFKVAEQEILSLVGDFVPAPEVKNGLRYVGTVTFAQAVDIEKVREDLALEAPIGRVALTCTQDEEPGIVEITSDVIIRTEQGQNFTFTLPGRYTADGEKWEKIVFLPAIGVFRVLAHMDMSMPEAEQPIYGFRFSDPIKTDIDLSGYVSIAPDVEYQVRIKGKYLIVQGDFIPGMAYTMTIAQGFPSVFGSKLASEYVAQFYLGNMKPEAEWLSEGVYLPTDNRFKLQFKTVNVARVRLEIMEIFPQNLGFFIQNNALLGLNQERRRQYYRTRTYVDLRRVAESIHSDTLDIADERNRWVKTEVDLSSVLAGKKNSMFVVHLRFGHQDLVGRCVNNRDELQEGDLYYEKSDYYNDPCWPGYYYSRGNLSKLLISSDIGLTVKSADDGLHVFAANVHNARPVGGLKLSLFTYQNVLVETQTTDSDGYARFTEKGSYIFGKNESGIALIKHNHPSWQINTFDVAGSAGRSKGINVFMYTDRGVHRPGDAVHFSAIIRMDRELPPENQPVILKVKNPKGQIVYENKAICGFNGHVYFEIPTDVDDPTGSWTAELIIGDQTFTETLRIETVKPQRLKIDIDLPEEIHAPQKPLRGTIACKYLFGAPGANLKTSVRIDLTSRNFTTDKFGDYIFSTPTRTFQHRTVTAFDGRLNNEGVHYLDYELPDMTGAPGLIRGLLSATVYERGGSFAQEQRVTTIYPFTAFAGIKDVFEWGSAKIGETYSVPIIVVDDQGEPVAGHELKVAVYVNREHWWWDYDRRDRRDFRRMESTYLIDERVYHSRSEPILHKMPIEDRGRHLIEVTDASSGHQAGLFFYASQWGRPAPTEEKERNYLQITSDKNVYSIGDRVTLAFETPSEGMALFSLEQGERIIRREWKPVQSQRTSFSFEVTDDLVPNCYASISLIQPHNQNTNDLPMRIYGIKTVYIEDPSTHLPLQLSAPKEIKPKEKFTVDVTSAASRRATYTIAIVDEGLLDLTDFTTPNPWDHFFQKVRLGVTTLDNFDEIIGILYPDIDRYFSIGGGLAVAELPAEAKRLARMRVKRFRPVVLFQEPITIEPGATRQSSFTMPNYVGSVRIMVIGASGHSYASIEETVPVKQGLMILPTLPRVARPGDKFAMPVSVFAMDSTIRDVELSLSLSKNLAVEGPRKIDVRFTKPGERDTLFAISVGDRVGADTVTVAASSDAVKADYTVHLPVTSPNPFYTEVTDTAVVRGQPVTLVPEEFGLEGTNKAKIAFSRMPDIQLDKRVAYLIRYPYGCIEQTVSSAFPQIFLPNLVDLRPDQKQAITDNVNATIKKLQRFKMRRGFAFWPVSNDHKPNYSDWGTSYTGHFLVEAKALGYHVPKELYDHWLADAKRKAKKVNKSNHRYQTYRLFLLALAGEPHIGGMNLVRENYLSALDPLSRKLLAAAYHISGKKDVADHIERSAPTEITDYREMSGTYGSALRDRALMAYLCVKLGDMQTASFLMREVVKSFRPRRWYSTQEMSMAVLSIGTYYGASPFVGGAVKFKVKMGDEGEKEMMLGGYQTVQELHDMWGKEITITNESENPLFVSLFEEGIPIEDRITTGYHGIQLTRNFYNEDGLPISAEERLQGEPFWVVYKVKSIYETALEELALSSVFPSGWEIVNPRLTGEPQPEWLRRLGITSGEFMDIRDDRVNWFFDIGVNQVATFGILINPTFKGAYRLPPVVVEGMYSPEFYARIAGGEVVVK